MKPGDRHPLKNHKATATSFFCPIDLLFFFVAKTMSAKSRAISKVACGRAASNAAFLMDCSFSGEASHELTVSAMTDGSPLYLPNPAFSTNGMFPSS